MKQAANKANADRQRINASRAAEWEMKEENKTRKREKGRERDYTEKGKDRKRKSEKGRKGESGRRSFNSAGRACLGGHL